jgi:hypothetical protein
VGWIATRCFTSHHPLPLHPPLAQLRPHVWPGRLRPVVRLPRHPV